MSPFFEYIPFAERACEFFTASPDPFHVIHNSTSRLEKEGYQRLKTTEPFAGKLQPGGKYYYVVSQTTLVAFAVGGKFDPKIPFGFHVIGGHTDSPNLKVKPRSKRTASGCTMLAVECYGGGLWHTWFDRDLSISGRVLVQRKPAPSSPSSSSSSSSSSDEGRGTFLKTEQHLVKLENPIARISTLAIHLQSAEERKGFSVNKENHTAPIIATASKAHGIAPSKPNDDAKEALEKGASDQLNKWQESQEPLLLKVIADKLGIRVDEIVDFELNLYDTQAASLGGIQTEFVYSARLDNLATVFTGLEGLIDYSAAGNTHHESSSDIAMAVFFDHEEIGSTSVQGANSTVMTEAISRISAAMNGGVTNPDFQGACAKKSFILSIDMAHAIHPNYSSKHEASHAPKLNGGFVIKTNSNQRCVLSVLGLR
jgi:aspartyl aminopeptidase